MGREMLDVCWVTATDGFSPLLVSTCWVPTMDMGWGMSGSSGSLWGWECGLLVDCWILVICGKSDLVIGVFFFNRPLCKHN